MHSTTRTSERKGKPMKQACVFTLVLALCALCAQPNPSCAAQPDFASFFAAFQKAVAAGDKKAVADMTEFGGFTWESEQTPVAEREAFLERFDRLFTPFVKKQIASAKPVKVDEDRYFISWRVKNLEHSPYFIRTESGYFAFLGLTAGPA
jgi:hypothetical protein